MDDIEELLQDLIEQQKLTNEFLRIIAYIPLANGNHNEVYKKMLKQCERIFRKVNNNE